MSYTSRSRTAFLLPFQIESEGSQHHILACLWSTILAIVGHGQHPVLAPTTNTTIVVPAGTLHYSAIAIPAGVIVWFVAPGHGPTSVQNMPAVVVCDGDVIVHGTLSVAGDPGNTSPSNTYPAGWVATGRGSQGFECVSTFYTSPGGGAHAGAYGAAIPFDLQGDSFGGDLNVYDSNCFQYVRTEGGGEGGGALALHAGGRIEVHGSVTADGLAWSRTGGGGGSGGSILLRGDAGVHVYPGGSVTARGGTITNPINPVINGAPGYVRLDAWGAPPIIQGTIDPPATVLELPHLRTMSPPQIGTTWTLDVLAPQNAPVFVSVSLLPVAGTPTPFGPLGIDLSVAASLGVSVPQPSHDPIASMPMAIPNAPALIGLSLWAQGIAVPQVLAPRLTNTVAVTVQ